jgi:preprotein translocase subunit SecA
LEFDDIINQQRKSIYDRRKRLLMGSIEDVEKDLEEIVAGISVAKNQPLSAGAMLKTKTYENEDKTDAGLEEKKEKFREIINKKVAEFGREHFYNAVRMILLQTIDMYWVEHLEVMDYTRSSVNLRAYGQRDPLVEYKKEGVRLFKEMQGVMKEQVLKILPHVVPVVNGQPVNGGNGAGGTVGGVDGAELKEVHENAQIIGAGDGSAGANDGSANGGAKKEEVGRNDLCPCGSGKKFKKCHGKNG